MSLRETGKTVLKRLLGTRDIRSYIRIRKNALHKKIYKAPISQAQLGSTLEDMGLGKGRVVWVQSSWNEFYNFEGKPRDVIGLLQEIIGPEGTIAMPAIPVEIDPAKVFEVDRAPVSTGMICEYFRRYPGVRRSIHLASSVVALGPEADFLTKDHHLTETAWDPGSPYERLIELDALCIGMGIGKFLESLTPLHVVEARLRHEIPYFRDLFHGTTEYDWKTGDGRTGRHKMLHRHGIFDAGKLGRRYPRALYQARKLSNLDLWSIAAKDAIETGISLGRQGVTMYKHPRPERSAFAPTSSE